jgi:hypothetical protein
MFSNILSYITAITTVVNTSTVSTISATLSTIETGSNQEKPGKSTNPNSAFPVSSGFNCISEMDVTFIGSIVTIMFIICRK